MSKEITPGPWSWRLTKDGYIRGGYMGGARICGSPQNLRVTMCDAITVVNANLIVAAPELLAELKTVSEIAHKSRNESQAGGMVLAHLEKIDAILAKAGETP
jgi:hypothetical protein